MIALPVCHTAFTKEANRESWAGPCRRAHSHHTGYHLLRWTSFQPRGSVVGMCLYREFSWDKPSWHAWIPIRELLWS